MILTLFLSVFLLHLPTDIKIIVDQTSAASWLFVTGFMPQHARLIDEGAKDQRSRNGAHQTHLDPLQTQCKRTLLVLNTPKRSREEQQLYTDKSSCWQQTHLSVADNAGIVARNVKSISTKQSPTKYGRLWQRDSHMTLVASGSIWVDWPMQLQLL